MLPIEAQTSENVPTDCEELWITAQERSRDDALSSDIQLAIVAYDGLIKDCSNESTSEEKFEYRWRLVRAVFMAAESTQAAPERMRWLVKGEKIADELMASHPDRVEGFYYAALLKGRRAQYSGLGFGALALAKQVEKIGQRAVEISRDFENGGPLRFMAMLYAKAPPWPTGMGDMDRAYDYANEALALSDYPLNHLMHAEVLIEDAEYARAREVLQKILSAPKTGQWAYEGEKWRPYIQDLLKKIENK